MSSRDITRWETAISKVVSADGREEVIVRGRPLSELIGRCTFAEMMFLLLQGRMPSPPQARLLDALLVASVEHGIAPPSMVSRCLASYGSPIQAAMAAGTLAFGDWMGGAGEDFARILSERIGSPLPDDDGLRETARSIVEDAHARGERIPGFGIPLHGADPRAPKLLELARSEGVLGSHCRLASLVEEELARRLGRRVPMNLDGVGAALILDLGFPWRSARMFIITPRSVSMAAHYLEELGQGTRWRHIPTELIDYGPDAAEG